jgi:hypothetical protein
MVTVVIHVGDCADEASVVAVFGCREREAPGVLSDVEWFEEEVQTAGLDYLLELSDPDRPVQPGYWLVQGHCWGEHNYSVNGDDYDGGFEIEQFDRLSSDPRQAARQVYAAAGIAGNDVAVVEDLLRGLYEPGLILENGLSRVGDLHALLTVLLEVREA